MRSPSQPDTQEFKASEHPTRSAQVKRDPSYPDRKRIDSDVRAFMRPVSTPWIVFDRDSRIDDQAPDSKQYAFAHAALRRGAVFASSPELRDENAPLAIVPSAASRLAETNAMFPASIASQPTGEIEPSSLIVAKDLVEEPSDVPAFLPPKRSGLKLAIATAAIVGIAAGGTLAFTRSVDNAPAPAQAAAPPVEQVVVATTPVTPPPAPEPVAAPVITVSEVVGEKATDPAKRWGTLTIKPDAKTKTVWLDGKRMLGTGKRSFMVYCGMHTVAVNEKAEQKDMEVPCNGELVIGK